MANYVLDMTKAHKQSFIELVNHDNVATVGTALTLADVLLVNERVVAPEESIPREYAVTLQNANYAPDTVEVYFNKVALADVTAMTLEDGDFDWYSPDEWDAGTSPALAVAAFKAAALRDGIDLDAAADLVSVTRRLDGTENRYYLDFEVTSMVFKPTYSVAMPKHFSETITTTQLNGFIYSPIQEADVVE